MNLENGGERMDINYYDLNYNNFDMYQKSHYKRYEYVQKIIKQNEYLADMACGTGYGTMMISEKCKKIDGYDIDKTTISEIQNRYINEKNVSFICKNLLDIDVYEKYDTITSFETIEHFNPEEIGKLMKIFNNALKKEGKLIFSTPYNQEMCNFSIKFHKTFQIKEEHIKKITENLFNIETFMYQNYTNHDLVSVLNEKHFIICVATKI